MAAAGEETEEKKNLPMQGAHGDGFQHMAFFWFFGNLNGKK